jgi:hypothetical protein
MKRLSGALALLAACAAAQAHVSSSVVVEIVGTDGRSFREIPVTARDGAQRSYLLAEKGARYAVRVRNTGGERLGLVIAVDGRNIIDGRKSELARGEPMYVLGAWDTQSYAGWRANLDAINEFYFTDWSDSYAEAFADRSARGVIAVAVYPEVPPPPPAPAPYRGEEGSRGDAAGAAAPAAESRDLAKSERRADSAGTGYGERRVDRAVQVEFQAQSKAESRHLIKYEWRETLCRKRVLECGEQNRFWDESVLGFAPPPPRRASHRR